MLWQLIWCSLALSTSANLFCQNFDLQYDRKAPTSMYVHTALRNSAGLGGMYFRESDTLYMRADPPMTLEYSSRAWRFVDGGREQVVSNPCDLSSTCPWPQPFPYWPASAPHIRALYGLAWMPSVTTMSTATCARVSTAGKLESARLAELAKGLEQATALKELTLNFMSAIDLNTSSPAMTRFFESLRTAPIKDFSLWGSRREEWPVEVYSSFMSAVPNATSVSLHLEGSKLNGMELSEAMERVVRTFPVAAEALRLNLNGHRFDERLVTVLEAGFGAHSPFESLQDISITVSDSKAGADISATDKIKLFRSLSAKGYANCSFTCDKITELADLTTEDKQLASIACSGSGNCASPSASATGDVYVSAADKVSLFPSLYAVGFENASSACDIVTSDDSSVARTACAARK